MKQCWGEKVGECGHVNISITGKETEALDLQSEGSF